MKKAIWLALALAAPAAVFGADLHSNWQFFFPDVDQPVAAPRAGTYSLPGSAKHYTQAEVDNLMSAPDWFPESHPPAPKAVVMGGGKGAFACGSCHLMSGMGHPESASLAGKPLAYLARQMTDFKSGARTSHVVVDGKPVVEGVQFMVMIAKSWPDEDVLPALQYFASLEPRRWVRVVEASVVPKSYVNAGYMRVAAPGGQKEPLGERIVELPQDLERQVLRDPRSGTVAYVPTGSVARGKALVSKGATACAACHGPELRGQGDVPGIAGRSPVYAYRQLSLFKDGSRGGPMAALMKEVIAHLSDTDMIAVSAYLATRAP